MAKLEGGKCLFMRDVSNCSPNLAGDPTPFQRYQIAMNGEKRFWSARLSAITLNLQLISPALIDEGPDGAFSTKLLWDLAASRGRLFGATHTGRWMHVGDPEGLAIATAQLSQNGR